METYQPRNLLQPSEKNFKQRFEWNKFDPGGNIYLTELKAGKPYESRMLLVNGGLFEDEGYALSATSKTSFKNQVRDWLDYNEVFNRKYCKSKAREKVGFVLSRKIDKILESHLRKMAILANGTMNWILPSVPCDFLEKNSWKIIYSVPNNEYRPKYTKILQDFS